MSGFGSLSSYRFRFSSTVQLSTGDAVTDRAVEYDFTGFWSVVAPNNQTVGPVRNYKLFPSVGDVVRHDAFKMFLGRLAKCNCVHCFENWYVKN